MKVGSTNYSNKNPIILILLLLKRKNIKFIVQETNPAAHAEVTFIPQVGQYVQDMQILTKFPSPLMVVLWPVLAPILVTYGFVDASAEGFGG